MMSEHQKQLGQYWETAQAQAAAEAGAERQRAAQLQAALADSDAALGATRHDLAKKEESLLELQNDMKKMLLEFDHQADEMKKVIVNQNKDLKELRESNEILTKALANQEEFTKSICTENNQLKDKVSGLEEDLVSASSKIKELDTALQAAICNRDELKNEIEVLMKENEELDIAGNNKNERIVELETEIQNMKQQMSSLEGEKCEVSENLNRANEACVSKDARIEELEKMREEETKTVQGLEEKLAEEKAAAAEAAAANQLSAAEKERELDEKARTIGQLMGDVKAHSDARARLDCALAAARKDAAEKEAELSKQMSIMLKIRAEKERLELMIEGTRNQIDDIQQELDRSAARPPPPDHDDNALMCPPPTRDIPASPPLQTSESNQLDSMLFSLLSDTSTDGAGDTLDANVVSRRFEALSRGEYLPPVPLGTLRQRAASHRRRGAGSGTRAGSAVQQDDILSLSQIRNDMKNREKSFFKNKRPRIK